MTWKGSEAHLKEAGDLYSTFVFSNTEASYHRFPNLHVYAKEVQGPRHQSFPLLSAHGPLLSGHAPLVFAHAPLLFLPLLHHHLQFHAHDFLMIFEEYV